MQLSATFIDSGAFTQDVYSFTKAHIGERIYAVKGFSGALPIISKIRRTKYNVPIIEIGVDAVKDIIYSRLHATDRQFFHFPFHLRRDFFEQLLSERPITRFSRGYQITRGWKKIRERNEALDATVYAIAAFYLVQEVSPIPKMRNLPQKPVEPSQPQQKPVQNMRRRKGGWLSSYHLTI
jgi:phage terminase large subunit GpA-like protein